MRRLLRGSALLLAASSTFALGAAAETPTNIQFTKYRIESNDCPGCGPSNIGSVAELGAYLQDMRAHLEGEGDGGVYVGASSSDIDEDTQVVFLDFDAGGEPTFPVCMDTGTVDEAGNTIFTTFFIGTDHIYTPEERDEIQARIEADYADFNFAFTQEEPVTGDFTTLFIGQNDAPLDCSEGSNITITPDFFVSILFGAAESIDFLNVDRNDTAFVDASFWEFGAQFGGVGLFEAFSGISVADFGGDLTAALSEAVVNQTANTSAHEAGHIQGLRHQNSFGAPGDGIPPALSPDDFVPIFDGPSTAEESLLHTMASGASVGLALTGSTITDRFFSERSATRLAVNEQVIIDTETRIDRRRGRVNLRTTEVPNTIIEGQNADAELEVRAAVIEGSISSVGDVDSFTFRGLAGEFFNAEILPTFALGQTFEEGILGQLRLYQVNRDGSEVLIAENIRSFESVLDTEIFDAVLPASSVYRVEVSAPNEIFLDLDGDGTIDQTTLDDPEVDVPELQEGEYTLLFFTCDKVLDEDIS
ncbi:MAG: hypothetical protein AAGK23_06870 [Pseudomonadota bacterium]